MNKVWKLFVDENIKTWKKASTKIILILIILSLFGTLALTKLMEKYYKDNIVMYSANAETERWKENVKEEIKRIESSIENENLDDDTIYDLTVQKEKYEISLKYNINLYNAGWKREVIEEIATEKVNDNNSDKISRLEQMLEKQDYKEYINYQKEQLADELKNNLITQQDYDDKLMILELKGKYNIDTIYDFYSKDGWKNMIISYIENAQNSLKTGLDQSNQKLLTVESKQKLEDDIKIGIYRLENNIPDPNYEDSNYRARFEALATSFVMAVIAVASIIIAGGEIATEISSGTIKFWALTPNKRWKIVTAKLLSVLFYMIIITLIMSVLTIIVANVAFTQEGSVYLYVKDGVVHEISNPIYMIETYFVKLIPVIIFAIFSLMLSTITRNAAVAVSFGIATYMGNGIMMLIINQYIKQEWVKFIPFNNLNIAGRIFPDAYNPMTIITTQPTGLVFALCVLAVCVVLMLVTMYDSFNKRDII